MNTDPTIEAAIAEASDAHSAAQAAKDKQNAVVTETERRLAEARQSVLDIEEEIKTGCYILHDLSAAEQSARGRLILAIRRRDRGAP